MPLQTDAQEPLAARRSRTPHVVVLVLLLVLVLASGATITYCALAREPLVVAPYIVVGPACRPRPHYPIATFLLPGDHSVIVLRRRLVGEECARVGGFALYRIIPASRLPDWPPSYWEDLVY
jgi:hypothetical protein